MDTEVHVQVKTPTTAWQDITADSGNLRLAPSVSNPHQSEFQPFHERNFTIIGYAISRDNQIMCAAASDYSDANGTMVANVTVRDTPTRQCS